MVIFQTVEGSPGYHQSEALDDAVQFVERLRNEQGIESARIFSMEEVEFDFKPYFRVELGASQASQAQPPENAPAPPAQAPAPGPTPPSPPPLPERPSAESEPAPPPPPPAPPTPERPGADSGIGARRGLFGR
ncbi:MAG: hypothetical protein DCC48_07910 [Acidobacteria bacterium]|nr:MAG: hypothetical protein DCC48_07910 [Acidobacteriota bacterium]